MNPTNQNLTGIVANPYSTQGSNTLNLGNPGNLPTVPNTLNASNIGSNKSVNTPPVINQGNFLNELTANYQTNLNSLQNQQQNAQSSIQDLMNQLTGQTGDKITAENQAGLPQLNTQLRDLQTLSQRQLASYAQNIFNNDVNATGATRTAQTGNEAQITRQHGIDAMITNANISAISGQIQTAQAQVDRAMSLKYDPIKQVIENQKFILEQINTKEARAASMVKELQLKEVENTQSFQTTALKNAIASNAPVEVQQAISRAKNINEVLEVGKGYLANPKDSLDMELTKSQIAKNYADARKNDINSGTLDENTLRKIDASPQGKKLVSLSGLYQKLQTYKNLVDTYGFKAAGDKKTLLDNAYADLKIAYKEAANLGALTGPDVGLIEEAIKPSSGATNYLDYKLSGGKSGVSGGTEQALIKARNEAVQNYKQLTSRNPNYKGSDYVKGLISPFAKDYNTVDIDTVPVGEIIETEDGILLESLGGGKFSPL